MKFQLPIPEGLSHLRIDERGYPIPFFAAMVEGKHDFRLLSQQKQLICVQQKLCAICGKKLPKDYVYVISGPDGYNNKFVSDPPMHRMCAEFTLKACPHLYYEKAQRNERGDIYKSARDNNVVKDAGKPTEIRLIRCNKYELKKVLHSTLIKIRPVSYEAYRYINGILTKTTES